MPKEQEGPNQWPNAERWNVSPWVMYMNKVLGKLRLPYDLKKRFDHREDMVSMEQVGNFELLINNILEHGVEGEFVELGCYTGSTAAVFAALLAAHGDDSRKLHVYDRFDIELGSARGIREIFEQNIRETHAPMPVIHAGDVFETVPNELPEKIAFAHIDLGTGAPTDIHRKLIDHALRSVYPRMSPNGVMVFMDYHVPNVTVNGHDSNPGVRAACDAFFQNKPERIKLLYGGPCSHAYIRKQA